MLVKLDHLARNRAENEKYVNHYLGFDWKLWYEGTESTIFSWAQWWIFYENAISVFAKQRSHPGDCVWSVPPMSLGPPKTHWAVSPLNAPCGPAPPLHVGLPATTSNGRNIGPWCGHPIWKHKIKLGINIIVLILLDMLIRLSDDICTHEKHQSLWQGVNTWGYAFIRNPRTLTTDKALPHTFTCPAKNPTDPTVDGGKPCTSCDS